MRFSLNESVFRKNLGLVEHQNVCLKKSVTPLDFHSCITCLTVVVMQRQSNPITGLDRPIGFQEVEAPRFQDIRHMKVVWLSSYVVVM
jgi:hypothetical protein